MNPLHCRFLAGATILILSGCGGGGGDTAPGQSVAATNPQEACQEFATSFQLAGHKVDAAGYLAPGLIPPGSQTRVAVPFCRVQMTSKPSVDSDLRSELWMPAVASWNGRFLAVGGSGNSASIMYAAMTGGLLKGFATLSTNNGHVGQDQSFAIGHPEKVIDFGHRAQALAAVVGKAAAAS